MNPDSIRALTFDVFGTVVDWRASIIREGEAFGRGRGLTVDWARFADAWRGLYQPAMDEVRSGRRPWTKLDDLHRESMSGGRGPRGGPPRPEGVDVDYPQLARDPVTAFM